MEASLESAQSLGQHGCRDCRLIQDDALPQMLASLATALWRIQTKLQAAGESELPTELRYLPRHLQAAWDALSAARVEVEDPTGRPYVPGMAVNPITFQPTEGAVSEAIVETIKPSVFCGDTLIQRADVIVARPLEPADQATPQPRSATTADTLGDDSELPGVDSSEE